MLEQAIVDAKSLREAALKNAEQAIIEQYAPKIKEAVESMLGESDDKRHIGERVKYEGRIYEVSVGSENGQVGLKELDGKTHMVNESEVSDLTEQDLLQEEEAMGGSSVGNEAGGSSIEAPFAGNPRVDPERTVEYSVEMEEPIYKFNLEDLKAEMESEEQTGEEPPPQESTDDLLGDLDLGVEPQAGPEEPEAPEEDVLSGLNLQEDLVTEIENMLKEIVNEEEEEEEELLEEELIVDLAGVNKGGWTETFAPTIGRQYEEELANMQSTKYIEENEVLNQKLKDLKENYKKLQMKNKQKKQNKISLDLVLDLESGEYIDFNDANDSVEQELSKLHWYDRKVYNLIQDEYSITELSKKTNITYHSLYNTYRKVKDRLKEKLKE